MTTGHTTPAGRPDVIIVGGGIGGLSAAYALSRKGLRVRAATSARRSSARSVPACRSRRTARASSTTTACSTRPSPLGVLPESMVMKDADGRVSELTRLDLLDLESKYGFPYMVIHRSDLHGDLPTLVPAPRDRARHRQAVQYAYEQGDGRATAVFFDGATRRRGRGRDRG